MRLKKELLVLILIPLLFLSMFFGYLIYVVSNSDELGSKHEYSLLQVTYSKIKNAPPEKNEIKIRRFEQYAVACFLAESDKGIVCLMLNPKSEPLIKTMPDEREFSLSKNSYIKLVSENEIILPVRAFLANKLE